MSCGKTGRGPGNKTFQVYMCVPGVHFFIAPLKQTKIAGIVTAADYWDNCGVGSYVNYPDRRKKWCKILKTVCVNCNFNLDSTCKFTKFFQLTKKVYQHVL